MLYGKLLCHNDTHSPNINTLYSALLIQKAVPDKYHPYYRKWLRYYLDFCQKYGFIQSEKPKVLYICLESGVPLTFIQAGLSSDFIN